MRRTRRLGWLSLVAAALVACAQSDAVEPRGGDSVDRAAVVTPSSSPSPSSSPAAEPSQTPVRPDWLGTRVLPERDDGIGEIQPTPPELMDRRFPPPDAQPVADEFVADIGEIPADVLARSTWTDECPVGRDELRYITMTFWGFDGRTYEGEMIVNAGVADDIVDVFGRLYEERFPIEEMRVVAPDELDASPTGDGNNTSAFVCRPTTLSDKWSQHAYGLAVDVNPFHNPYERDDVVLPELASAYLDRDRDLPGMVDAGGVVVQAFADIGWGWGGQWDSLADWMHFSENGR